MEVVCIVFVTCQVQEPNALRNNELYLHGRRLLREPLHSAALAAQGEGLRLRRGRRISVREGGGGGGSPSSLKPGSLFTPLEPGCAPGSPRKWH